MPPSRLDHGSYPFRHTLRISDVTNIRTRIRKKLCEYIANVFGNEKGNYLWNNKETVKIYNIFIKYNLGTPCHSIIINILPT